MSFVAIDFETAAGSRGSACAVGWAVVEDNTIQESGTQLINPQIPAEEWNDFNIGLHGIRPTDVKGSPTFSEVWPGIAKLAAGRPFVAHYAAFDTGVVREEHARFSLPLAPFKYLCSARLAQVAWPNLLSVSLPVVANQLALTLDHHNARSDAETAASITIAAIQQAGVTDLKSAVEHYHLLWGEVRATTGSMEIRRANDPSHPLFGQIIVFTGELQTMPRGEAHRIVYEAGGTPGNSVTRTTTILVSGDQDLRKFAVGAVQSTKFQKAQQFRDAGCEIQLLGEEDFLRLL